MFMAFGGSNYYPEGGWRDFIGMATSLEDAIDLRGDEHDWFHIVQLGIGIIYNG